MPENQNLAATHQIISPQQLVYQDEISLVDIWITLKRHKKVMLWVFIATVMASIIAALVIPKKYQVLTSLEIGSTIKDSKPVPIVSPETVKAKLENSFIPALQYKLHSSAPDIAPYDIKIQIPKNSEIIVFRSKALESDVEAYKTFHRSLINSVESNHTQLVSSLKDDLVGEIEKAKIELDALEDEATLAAKKQEILKPLTEAQEELKKLSSPIIFGVEIKQAENRIHLEKNKLASLKNSAKSLESELKRINVSQDLIRDEIESLDNYLKLSSNQQLESTSQVKDQNSAMTQLLIGSEIQKMQERLSTLKEQLFITLEEKKSETKSRLEDLEQQQALQEAKIAHSNAALDELLESNKTDQVKAQAMIDELEAKLAKLVSDHRRLIQEKRQEVENFQSKLGNFSETRAVVEPTRSIQPVSISRKTIVLIGIILGLFIAPVSAVFAEIKKKVETAEANESKT